jgi:hypothetical protein
MLSRINDYEPQDRPSEVEQALLFKGSAWLSVFVGFVIFVVTALTTGPLAFILAPALTIVFAAWFYDLAITNTCKRNQAARLEREEEVFNPVIYC